jgi:hypothetical protein
LGRIGIWEKDEGIFRYLSQRLFRRGAKRHFIAGCGTPRQAAGRALELLVISPGAMGLGGRPKR